MSQVESDDDKFNYKKKYYIYEIFSCWNKLIYLMIFIKYIINY